MKKPIIFLLCGLAILGAVYLYPATASNMQDKAVIPEKFTLHVVKSGDTLWDLAGKHMPNVDPRRGIAEVRKVNGMPENYLIRVGDIITIPSIEGNLLEPSSASQRLNG